MFFFLLSANSSPRDSATVDCLWRYIIYKSTRCSVGAGNMSDDLAIELEEIQKPSLVPSIVSAEFLKPGPVKVVLLGVSVVTKPF